MEDDTARETGTGGKVLALVSALLLGIVGLAVGSLIAGLAVAVVQVTVGDVPLALYLVVSLVSIQGIGCVLVSVLYLRTRPQIASRMERTLGWERLRRRLDVDVGVPSAKELLLVLGGWIVAFFGVLVAAVVVQTVLQRVLGEQPSGGSHQIAEIGLEEPWLLLLLIPASFLLIGPGEELLFRGIVQGRLREVFGPVPSVLVASAFFAGIHFTALVGGSTAGNVARLTVLLVPALVLGATYEYTDNLVVPALIHGLYNATLFGLLYVAVQTVDDVQELQEGAAAILGA